LVDLVIQHGTRQLSRLQQKSDFRPKEDSVLPDGSGCSTAAAEVVAFLKSHSHSVISHLRGKNLGIQVMITIICTEFNQDQYLLVLGIRIHEVLSAHLKSFTISNAGALLLMRDIREYQVKRNSGLRIVANRYFRRNAFENSISFQLSTNLKLYVI
jgi:hypothetical protein